MEQISLGKSNRWCVAKDFSSVCLSSFHLYEPLISRHPTLCVASTYGSYANVSRMMQLLNTMCGKHQSAHIECC